MDENALRFRLEDPPPTLNLPAYLSYRWDADRGLYVLDPIPETCPCCDRPWPKPEKEEPHA